MHTKQKLRRVLRDIAVKLKESGGRVDYLASHALFFHSSCSNLPLLFHSSCSNLKLVIHHDNHRMKLNLSRGICSLLDKEVNLLHSIFNVRYYVFFILSVLFIGLLPPKHHTPLEYSCDS